MKAAGLNTVSIYIHWYVLTSSVAVRVKEVLKTMQGVLSILLRECSILKDFDLFRYCSTPQRMLAYGSFYAQVHLLYEMSLVYTKLAFLQVLT